MPPSESLELGVAEVGYPAIPVQASEDAEGAFDLWLELQVHGSRGERIRKRRASALGVRWPWWFRGLGLLAGHLLVGGGIKARVEIVPGAPVGETDPSVGVRWHRLFPES